ncbi:MAG: cytochrome b N-terminal domain-containing protein [Betaproteobacteria bacterium]|nr:cytochrome b N-terminal domain-containing protein [Betaproteobacteria bacterium]
MATALSALRIADEGLTGVFDRAFAPANNPWRHLGALAFLCLVISVVSGIIAFALYDTSVAGAYDSGLRLQNDPLLLGRLLRGMHRYAADAFMALTVLHLVREALRGHYRGVRWFSWLTGVPLLWMLWLTGITGLWLLWDERALYSVTAAAEWLQALPLSSDLLARNFLTADTLNDRFFSLILFVHIGVPLLLLAAVWVHVERISLPRIWPPRSLTTGSLVMLALLALSVPAESLGPADTGHAVAQLSLDWFYLFPHPLVDAISAQWVWLLAAVLTVALAILPWVRRPGAKKELLARAARVDLANCNGCARCAADCPFGAVVMIPRQDQRNHPQQASVISDLCAACGICVGACPSSTPFRRIEDIVSGIEMPDMPIAGLRQQLQQKLAGLSGSSKVVVFACRLAANFESLADTSTTVIPLECAGMLPPSFFEYATRMGASGTVVAGCREADCEYRLGDLWVQERLRGARAPRLRAAAQRDRFAVVWAGREIDRVKAAIATLHADARLNPAKMNPATGPAVAFNEVQHD